MTFSANYLGPTYYNSQNSKPNGSASPFKETQLFDFAVCRLRSNDFHCRNPSRSAISSNSLNLGTSTLNNAGSPDISFPDTFSPEVLMSEAPAKARYIEEDFQKITKFCIDLFL